MFEKSDLQPSDAMKQPEHLSVATEIANMLTERFNPIEQNEFLKHVYSIVKERRQCLIEETDNKAAWLKETLVQLS